MRKGSGKRKGETRREKHLRLAYQWTDSIYYHNLLMQDMACAICGSEDPGHAKYDFVVDHNHETGEPRGLLCHCCNVGVGMFKERTENFANAITYLNEHAGVERTSVPANCSVS